MRPGRAAGSPCDLHPLEETDDDEREDDDDRTGHGGGVAGLELLEAHDIGVDREGLGAGADLVAAVDGDYLGSLW